MRGDRMNEQMCGGDTEVSLKHDPKTDGLRMCAGTSEQDCHVCLCVSVCVCVCLLQGSLLHQ